jgi:hypothetical protein
MATVYIAEFDRLLTDAQGKTVMAPHYPPVAPEQTVAITMTSAQSTAMGGTTRFVQLSCDAIFSFAVGPNPTATTTNSRVPANDTRFIGIDPGAKIAVILNT